MNTSAHFLREVRAVVCDVYGTLLRVGPPPLDAAERWRRGCERIARRAITLDEFDTRCGEAIAEQHRVGRASGEEWPEVNWLAVVRASSPQTSVRAIAGGDPATLLSSLHAACSRTCTAMPGALPALEILRNAAVHLGIASNAQHYTRGEIRHAGLSHDQFDAGLCFLSGEHGFAKPSPRVFAWLAGKLAARGIAPHETLMVGDSMENDIRPAAAAGWQTWLLTGVPDPNSRAGTWRQLCEAFAGVLRWNPDIR